MIRKMPGKRSVWLDPSLVVGVYGCTGYEEVRVILRTPTGLERRDFNFDSNSFDSPHMQADAWGAALAASPGEPYR